MRLEVRNWKLSMLLILLFALVGYTQNVPREIMIGDLRLTINERARKQIQKDVDRLTQNETFYNILVDRMNLYFPFIEREHRKYGIPDEIKFLAIQESGLISDAVSSANAVGFWQFKDFTAREVGLTVDRKVDERLNIVSSSRGTAKYFQTNNFFFNNWAYAVIAYQAGVSGAKKHTDASKYGAKRLTITPKSYWYLKKFIAHIIAFSQAVGRSHSENIWLDKDTHSGGKTLEQIARKYGVDHAELKKYNKWLHRGKVPTDKTYSVMIPKIGTPPKRAIASNQYDQPKKTPISQPKVYPTQIKPGITQPNRSTIIPLNGIPSILARENDDVYLLSARGGISEKRFRMYNDMSSDEQVIPDEFYYVKKKKKKAVVGYHVVQKEETFWEISQKYGISMVRLAKKNRMNVIDELDVGRVLWLNKTRPSYEPVTYHTMTPEVETTVMPVADRIKSRRKVKIHTVRKGESLSSISRLYGVTTENILRWNNLSEPDVIKVGQNIQVKIPIEEASVGKNIIKYIVQIGDTLYAISQKYNMTVDEVMDLNGMKTPDLSEGQELKVYGGKD